VTGDKERPIMLTRDCSKLVPVFSGEADYRGAYGGRGSAKTRSFAKMSAVKALQFAAAGQDGLIVCAREFMNSLDESSLAEVKAAILSEPWLAEHFDVGERMSAPSTARSNMISSGLPGIWTRSSPSRAFACCGSMRPSRFQKPRGRKRSTRFAKRAPRFG
jgi:hypothetical protein